MKKSFRKMEDKELKTYINSLIKSEIKNMKIAEGNNKENQNTVKYYEYYENENEFAIVMELCDSSLTIDLVKKGKNGYGIEEIKELLIQLNHTFKIMAEHKLVHRDIKPENILIKYDENKKKIYKLSDYGISKIINDKLTTLIGTQNYMAPEILKGETYDEKCDLWSLGVVIYNLYFKVFPYDGNASGSILNKIIEKGQTILKKTNNKNLDDLIRQLLVEDKDKRISWEAYFNHPFFKDN